TAKMERKKLFLITLFIFFLGNIFTYFSPTFELVMIARVLTAASAALIIVLALTITARITISSKRAKALGIFTWELVLRLFLVFQLELSLQMYSDGVLYF